MRDYQVPILNQPVDISKEFIKKENNYFVGSEIKDYNPQKHSGKIKWKRYSRKERIAFNQIMLPLEEEEAWEFPAEYEKDPVLPFSISFITPRTVRFRLTTRPEIRQSEREKLSLMLENNELPVDNSWKINKDDKATIYKSSCGSVKVNYDPFRFEFRDNKGNLLTQSQNFADTKSLINSEPIPFSFIRRVADMKRHIAATFSLGPDEKIFGGGESFTRLNKRGQKLVLCSSDAHGVQTDAMYKPIPFFLSSKGYGMFVHSSTPMTFDFGKSYDGANTIYLGDDYLDLFVFIGDPKEILSEYTALTGRSNVPPLWSFGLWMSRITFKSEEETREVAEKLRKNRIPCDVIHLDTGWFEEDWRCDYKFSETRFTDPEKMIDDLRDMGFHISLWQLPYFNPQNKLYKEAIKKDYVVRGPDGNLPSEDAVLDFSNPDAVRWYQKLLARLFKIGVEVIKADFGEAAPLHGVYHSGKSGFYEHNLYPLRYNKVVADITEKETGNSIIWGRSAWTGSQRYPLHWGGDAENTDCGMAASLRGGLSLGLCGFSFWSHDIGGFVEKSPEELYRRWLPFGMLTSHSRCHGAPPKEPWAYSQEFTDDFRQAVELKYRLMPYIYAQAKLSSQKGYPMMRTLFFEYPDDPTSWFIDDQYLFGNDLMVAPLINENTYERDVYLPPGKWVDYQTNKVYEGGKWHQIQADELPIIMLVKDGAAIPHLELAHSTEQMNWEKIQLQVYHVEETIGEGHICLPDDNVLNTLHLKVNENQDYALLNDPLVDRVEWEIEIIKG